MTLATRLTRNPSLLWCQHCHLLSPAQVSCSKFGDTLKALRTKTVKGELWTFRSQWPQEHRTQIYTNGPDIRKPDTYSHCSYLKALTEVIYYYLPRSWLEWNPEFYKVQNLLFHSKRPSLSLFFQLWYLKGHTFTSRAIIPSFSGYSKFRAGGRGARRLRNDTYREWSQHLWIQILIPLRQNLGLNCASWTLCRQGAMLGPEWEKSVIQSGESPYLTLSCILIVKLRGLLPGPQGSDWD